MLVDYPKEWHKYFIPGKTRTFSKNTPKSIIEKAMEINKTAIRYNGKQYFYFEYVE